MLGEYDHLNADTDVCIQSVETRFRDMPALVRAVRKSNWGWHRFMSEFVRQVREEDPSLYRQQRAVADAIAAILGER
jgi:hypothetical protein